MDQKQRSLRYELVISDNSFSKASIRGVASFDGWDVVILANMNSPIAGLGQPSLSIRMGANSKVEIAVVGEIQGDYVVESTDSLLGNNWTEIGLVPSDGTVWTAEISPGNHMEFYRIRNLTVSAR